MKIFLDTADVSMIGPAYETGLIDGVTTNPTLILRSGRTLEDVAQELSGYLNLESISTEVVADTAEEMLEQAQKFITISPAITIKLPCTVEGLKACKELSKVGVKTNVTLIFSVPQAILAAKAGATYVSPFIGRLDDISTDGLGLIENIRLIYDNYGFETEILAASVRHPMHIIECAQIGADVMTGPLSAIEALLKHPLTDIGLAKFLADHAKANS